MHVWFTPNLFSFSVYVFTAFLSFVVLLCTVNVATGKTYSQISKHQVQGSYSNAANGNTDGVYSNSNCIHTNVKNLYPYPNANPWWKVDLGRTYPVYTIKVWARTGCELYSFFFSFSLQVMRKNTSQFPHVGPLVTS